MFKIIKNRNLKRRINTISKVEKQTKKIVLNQIKKCLFLVDLENFNEIDFFSEVAKKFSVSEKNIVIIGFQNKEKNIDNQNVITFSWNDITFSGAIEKIEIQEIINSEFDIVCNYFSEEKNPLLFISSQVKTKLKIGFQGVNTIFNDVIISCQLSEKEVFLNEMYNIIKIIQ